MKVFTWFLNNVWLLVGWAFLIVNFWERELYLSLVAIGLFAFNALLAEVREVRTVLQQPAAITLDVPKAFPEQRVYRADRGRI